MSMAGDFTCSITFIVRTSPIASLTSTVIAIIDSDLLAGDELFAMIKTRAVKLSDTIAIAISVITFLTETSWDTVIETRWIELSVSEVT
jgi:hypothetical protein